MTFATYSTVADRLDEGSLQRPPRDEMVAAGLRATLEDALFALGPRDETPLIISSVRSPWPHGVSELAHSRLARLRGQLVAVALRLLVVDGLSDDPMADVAAAWRVTTTSPSARAELAALDDQERARLVSDVRAHVATLSDHFGVVAPSRMARSDVRSRVSLAGGLELRDRVDLTLGLSSSRTASMVLVDVTTSPLDDATIRTVRYHALVHTLKSGVAPWRSAIFSTATAELLSCEVTSEQLHESVEDVVDAMHGRLGA